MTDRESVTPMTLSDFANELSKICCTAVNLDTGNYGYGWYGKKKWKNDKERNGKILFTLSEQENGRRKRAGVRTDRGIWRL